MDDYRGIYMKFVESIAAFALQTIEQNGVISTTTLSNEISRIIAEQPEVCVALWARGLMVNSPREILPNNLTIADNDNRPNARGRAFAVRRRCNNIPAQLDNRTSLKSVQ